MCRSGSHKVICFRQSPTGTVIHHYAIISEHNAVPSFTNRKFGKRITVNSIDQLGRIRSLNSDFTKRCYIDQTDGFSGSDSFAYISLGDRFTFSGKVPRALPQTGLGHRAALREVPVMHWSAAQRFEVRPFAATCQCTQTDWSIRWPESSCSHLWNIFTLSFGHQRKTDDITHLTLIGGHTQSGIAL